MKHIRLRHKDCELENCHICDGGLFQCVLCGLVEVELTTDCCGQQIGKFTCDRIMEGKLNYRNGSWRMESIIEGNFIK